MTQEQKKFIERVGALAAADMQKSGVLASLTIAQAILESGWGTLSSIHPSWLSLWESCHRR